MKIEEFGNVALTKIAAAVGISASTLAATMKQPIAGVPYDPDAINYNALEALLDKRSTVNWRELNAADYMSTRKGEKITPLVGQVYTHRNYKEYNDNGEFVANYPLLVVYVTETHVCVENVKTHSLHAMLLQTFRAGSPELIAQ